MIILKNVCHSLDLRAFDIINELTELGLDNKSYRDFDLRQIQLEAILSKFKAYKLKFY